MVSPVRVLNSKIFDGAAILVFVLFEKTLELLLLLAAKPSNRIAPGRWYDVHDLELDLEPCETSLMRAFVKNIFVKQRHHKCLTEKTQPPEVFYKKSCF